MNTLATLAPETKQYLIITGNYWSFTLTDGALRMLVVLHFHGLGYSPLAIAMLFLFYEFFGVITNLVGGWLGSALGLNRTMNFGLALQIVALGMLLLPTELLSVPWVMAAQALSGIAKDLNKMSAKSAIKLLVPNNTQHTLYRWVALLTGSKNTLKGIGFFLGGALLHGWGFHGAIMFMLIMLVCVWLFSVTQLTDALGKSTRTPKFTHIFSKSRAINYLSAARLCLFAARDVWFVIALPVYMISTLGFSHTAVGSFLALWVIGYGAIQTIAPNITAQQGGNTPNGKSAYQWALLLAFVPAFIALMLKSDLQADWIILGGLLMFGAIFAINSSLHSYLIVSYANKDHVSLDVGFYYMANALGRLIGTVLSGGVFQAYGLEACLWLSSLLIISSAILATGLPKTDGIGPDNAP